MTLKRFAIIFLTVLSGVASAQQKISFRDSLDNKIDVSDWVLTAKGFIPMPYIITEPALGYIGGALAPVWIQPNTPYIDMVNGKEVRTRVKPNVYAAFAAYTANGTWMAGGGTRGTIKAWRLNYKAFAAYGDINLDFYRTGIAGEERTFAVSMRTLPVFGQVTRQLGRSDWAAGIDYLFFKSEINRVDDGFIEPHEFSMQVSRIGFPVEFDNRDNVFTPDKGLKWNTSLGLAFEEIGSSNDFTSLFTSACYYLPLTPALISGFRAEYQQMWGDPPFYMLPFILMRGIPVMRYQGDITTVLETEWRWDFSQRFSAVGFLGTGKAILNGDSFGDADLLVSGGAGWRYLMARKLGLRMGIDVARGPEKWAYYIVFGNNWIR